MKKIRNNYKLVLLYFFTLIILAGINFIAVNINLIKNRGNVGTFNIENVDKKIKKDNQIILISNLDKYVDTLHFSYNSDQTIIVKYEYEYYNSFGRITKKKFSTPLSYEINESYDTFRRNIKSIKITLNKEISIDNITIINKYQFNIYTYLFLSLLFLNIFLFIFKKEYFSKHIEKGFLVIALSIGLLLIICEPPFLNASWDDQIHFKSIYKIGTVKKKYPETVVDYSDLKIKYSMFNTNEERMNQIKYNNENTGDSKEIVGPKYSSFKFINYVPISLLYTVCEFLHVPFIIMFLLGKVLYFTIYTIIVYYAIKIIPKHKHLVCLLGLIPTSLFIASNYNYDTFINAFILLFISFFVYEKSRKNDSVNTKLLLISLFGMIIACFTKAIYAPLILILLLLPKEKFENIKKYKLFRIGVIMITIILCSTFVIPTVTNPAEVSDTRGGDTSEKRQIKSIIKSPVSFVKSFTGNYYYNFSDKMLGKKAVYSFSYFDKKSDNSLSNGYTIFLILLLLFILTDNYKEEYLKPKEKVYILLIVLLIIAFIWGALYLSFTPVGDDVIRGVQGRYFIPLIFPLSICFITNKIINNISKIKYSSILYFGMIYVLFELVFTKIILFYCF